MQNTIISLSSLSTVFDSLLLDIGISQGGLWYIPVTNRLEKLNFGRHNRRENVGYFLLFPLVHCVYVGV